MNRPSYYKYYQSVNKEYGIKFHEFYKLLKFDKTYEISSKCILNQYNETVDINVDLTVNVYFLLSGFNN